MQLDDVRGGTIVDKSQDNFNQTNVSKFRTLTTHFVPKTAAVSHRMKAFCCNIPDNL